MKWEAISNIFFLNHDWEHEAEHVPIPNRIQLCTSPFLMIILYLFPTESNYAHVPSKGEKRSGNKMLNVVFSFK